MEIFESAWYADFQCQAENCTENCCSGWMVPLTPEDRERFCREEGAIGRKLKRCMFLSGGETLNVHAGRCAFLDKEGLCGLQNGKGEGFIPEACRNYPRFYRNYGLFEERCIDLSCIHGARLFLKSESPLELYSYMGEPESRPCSTNDDVEFLEELQTLRRRLIQALKGVRTPEELSEAFGQIFWYCQEAQAEFARGRTDYFVMHPFLQNKTAPQGKMQKMFPFSAEPLKALMGTSFYHFRLRSHAPLLYRLCRLYLGKYKRAMDKEEKWEEMFLSFIQKNPQQVEEYAKFYGYYLLQHFLGCYQDYSFRRNAGLGIVHANMLMFLELLYEKLYGELREEACAEVLSAYVKRAYYNSDILEELYTAVFSS